MLLEYLRSVERRPLFIVGDSLHALASFPPECIDCCMTSPPYWGQRAYSGGGIGLEESYDEYVDGLLAIIAEVKRVLRPSGSFWLNIGDAYHRKSLVGIPWRIALAMTDRQRWILRNSVIWNKVKGGPDNTTDSKRNKGAKQRGQDSLILNWHALSSRHAMTTPSRRSRRAVPRPESRELSCPDFPQGGRANNES
jgi:DNA modification methylase